MKIRNETKIAIFAIAAVIIGIWGFKFLKGINVLTTSRVFYVRYQNVDQLLASSPVLVNGFQIGTVKKLEIDPVDDKTIIATLNIEGEADIHKEALAVIRSASIMGGKAIDIISPGPCDGDQCAQSGDFLKGSSKTFLQSVIGQPEELDAYTEKMLKGVTTIYDSIADPNDPQGLGRSLVALEQSLLNMEIMTRKINKVLDASANGISATANNTAEITGALKASNKDIAEALSNINALSTQLKNAGLDRTAQKAGGAIDSVSLALASLRNTLNTTQKAIQRVDTLAAGLVAGEGAAGKLLTDPELYDNFNRTSRHLYLLMQDLRLNPKRYTTIKVKWPGKLRVQKYTPPVDDPLYRMLIDSLEREYSRKLKQ
jgi:phospholipid/cholesterol/gamma-HCH transport system substrate-binding protein